MLKLLITMELRCLIFFLIFNHLNIISCLKIFNSQTNLAETKSNVKKIDLISNRLSRIADFKDYHSDVHRFIGFTAKKDSCCIENVMYNSDNVNHNIIKRASKIYPKTSVLVWSRRNFNRNNLVIRRKSIEKLRFQHTYSPGIKSKLQQSHSDKIFVKRSIDEDSESTESGDIKNVQTQTGFKHFKVENASRNDRDSVTRNETSRQGNRPGKFTIDLSETTSNNTESVLSSSRNASDESTSSNNSTIAEGNGSFDGSFVNRTFSLNNSNVHKLIESEEPVGNQNNGSIPVTISRNETISENNTGEVQDRRDDENFFKTANSTRVPNTNGTRIRLLKYKRPQISPELEKWLKSNTVNLAVISVPIRKCPPGQRINRGRCVQVY